MVGNPDDEPDPRGEPDEHHEPPTGGRSDARVATAARPGAARAAGDDRGIGAGGPRRPALPRQRRPPAPRHRAPVLVAAAATTVWAAVVSYLSVVAAVGLVVLVAGGASAGVVFRAGTGGWLLAHGVRLDTDGGPLGLVPLAVSAFVAWRIARAGVHTTRAIGGRRSAAWRPAALAAGSVGLVHGLLGLLAAVLADGDGLRVGTVRAGLTCAIFGAVAALIGAAGESGVAAAWWGRLPPVLRDGVRTGIVAALLILGAGAAAAGVAVAVNGGDASDMVAAYHAGVAGQAGLTLLCLVFAPNLAVWSMSYLVGPGFVVGAGATVSAAKVSLGALPAVPVLAGLPSTAASGLAAPLLGVPVAGGMVAGWLLVRRHTRRPEKGRPAPGWGAQLGAAAAAGPAAGLLLGLAAAASGGPLGSGRLAVIGPQGWWVGCASALAVGVGAVVAAAASRAVIGRPHR